MPRKPRNRYPQDDQDDRDDKPALVVRQVVLTKPETLGPVRKTLTSERIDQFCRALDLPATFEDAAKVVGFSARTLRSWIAAGEDEDCTDELCRELAHKVAQVMSGGHRSALLGLNLEHAVYDPKTALELLRIYSPSTQITKNVKVEATVAAVKKQVDYSVLTTHEIEAMNAIEHKLALAEKNKV